MRHVHELRSNSLSACVSEVVPIFKRGQIRHVLESRRDFRHVVVAQRSAAEGEFERRAAEETQQAIRANKAIEILRVQRG